MNAAVEPDVIPEIRTWRRFVPAAVSMLVFVVLISVVIYLIKGMLGSRPAPKKMMVQQITLIAPPPPPPVEKPPEPEIKEEVKLPEPVPEAANEPPPGSNLGVDADGGAGDNFGLVGKKGGRDLLSGGPFAWYATLIQQGITERMAQDKRVRRARYSVVLDLWIAPDGRIQRFELRNSTGDAALDESLKRSLAQLDRLQETPPQEMPQPLKIRITSRL